MITIFTDIDEARQGILRRRAFEDISVSPRVQQLSDALWGAGTTPAQAVERIIADVRVDGDAALRRYSQALEGVELDEIRGVTR